MSGTEARSAPNQETGHRIVAVPRSYRECYEISLASSITNREKKLQIKDNDQTSGREELTLGATKSASCVRQRFRAVRPSLWRGAFRKSDRSLEASRFARENRRACSQLTFPTR